MCPTKGVVVIYRSAQTSAPPETLNMDVSLAHATLRSEFCGGKSRGKYSRAITPR